VAISEAFDQLINGYRTEKKIAVDALRQLKTALDMYTLDTAVEEGYIPSFEDFKKLPIMQQNSVTAIQNERISLYRDVLLNPDKFIEVMTPLDADNVEKSIKSVSPDAKKVVDLDSYTMLGQVTDKHNFIGGKFGVGLTANQMVDAAISQIADITMQIPGLTQGHNKGEGIVDFTQMRDTKGRLISHVISAYLNAYVDIAKDPYIVTGNHNLLTANTVFMMLRAGIPFEFVNAFISQPSIREYVKISMLTEGRTGISFINAKKEVREMFSGQQTSEVEGEQVTDWQTIAETNPERLMEGLTTKDLGFTASIGKKEINEEYKGGVEVNQAQIFEAFLMLRDKAKDLSDSVLASKADTVGAGKNFIDAYTQLNRIENVLQRNEVLGFSNKFSNSALGTYSLNSLGLVNDMFKGMFLSNDQGFLNRLDFISKASNGTNLINAEFGDFIKRELYTGFLSSAFTMEDLAHQNLFFGTENIAWQLTKLQNSKKYEDNTLMQVFHPKSRYSKESNVGGLKMIIGSPSTVAFQNLRGVSTNTADQIMRDWEIMYESKDPAAKKFATDLVYSAFYQSGTRTRMSSYFHLVPPRVMYDLGITDKILNKVDKVKSNPGLLDVLINQIYKHNSKNEKLVPKLTRNAENPKWEALPGDVIPQKDAIAIPVGMSPKIITGADINNNPTHAMFIRTESYYLNNNEQVVENNLYQYLGNLTTKEGDVKAIYRRTNELGYNKYGTVVLEYDMNNNGISSIFEENMPNIDEVSRLALNTMTAKSESGRRMINYPGTVVDTKKSANDVKVLGNSKPTSKNDEQLQELVNKCKGK